MGESIIDSEYFYYKCLWAMAYGNGQLEIANYLFDVLNIDKLKMYNVFVDFMKINNMLLSDSARSNLLYFSNRLKSFISDVDYSIVDRKIADNSFFIESSFILSQYKIRFMGEISDSIISSENIGESFDMLKSMIYNDMYVLITHSCKYNQPEFENICVSKHVKYMLRYIASINMIKTEYPNVLTDELFLSRVNRIIDEIECSQKSPFNQKILTMFKEKNR